MGRVQFDDIEKAVSLDDGAPIAEMFEGERAWSNWLSEGDIGRAPGPVYFVAELLWLTQDPPKCRTATLTACLIPSAHRKKFFSVFVRFEFGEDESQPWPRATIVPLVESVDAILKKVEFPITLMSGPKVLADAKIIAVQHCY